MKLRLVTIAIALSAAATGSAHAQCPAYCTQWGSLGTDNGQFDLPHGAATDAAGNVYIADLFNHRIQKFTGAGAYIAQWGSFGSGDGEFDRPLTLATNAVGDVYVVDHFNHRIQKFTGTGAYLGQWGSHGSGDGEFDYPYGIATDAAGNVYVADLFNHRVQKFTGAGAYITQWGWLGSGDGEFNQPFGIAVDAVGDVYVADTYNHRIQKFTGAGAYITQWGSVGSGDGQFDRPAGVATDAAGNVFVTDLFNHRVQKFTGAGAYLCQWGSFGSGDGQFDWPWGVATDADDNVFVTDRSNHRIQKFGFGDGCGNAFPIAVCNSAVTIEAEGPDGALVVLDGSQSYDPDGDMLSYHWDVSGATLDNPEDPMPSGVFPIGITTATLTVGDGRGGVGTCDVVVTVQDTTPPQVECTSDIAMLWPPNHVMRTVTIYLAVSDLVGVSWDTASITILSDEPDDAQGNGDGATTGDVDGEDGYTSAVNITDRFVFDADLVAWVGTVQLRAERAGSGDGRCYTIDFSAADLAGNEVVTSCCIVVPHDQRPR